MRTPSDAAVSGRMIAELAALGFDVVEIGDDPDRALSDLAHDAGAVAAVRAADVRRVELWVVDPATHATAFEETVSIDAQRRADLLAVRAVEVLRARLVKVGLALPEHPPPPPREPQRPLPVATPPPDVAPAPREPLLWLDVGPSVHVSAGGIGAMPSATLGVRVAPAPRWGVLALVTLPLSSATVQSSEGRAEIQPALAGVSAQLRTTGEHWSLALGPGAGVLWVDMLGEKASPPYSGRTDRVTALAGFVDVSLCGRVFDGVGVCSSVWFGSSVPRVAVRFVDHDVATWGRPFAVAALRFEIAVPGLAR